MCEPQASTFPSATTNQTIVSSTPTAATTGTTGTSFLLDTAIPYTLTLRKFFQLNPSLEFRIFVRDRTVLGMTQRDLNHFPFLFALRPKLKSLILDFWEKNVRNVFAQSNYTMDVYVPPPHERVWVIDFNPWDLRTDPGLWSWGELLSMSVPDESSHTNGNAASSTTTRVYLNGDNKNDIGQDSSSDDDEDEDEDGGDEEDISDAFPELRLIRPDDPEAYMFNSPRYGAHKLPRDVVDASRAAADGDGGGLREFATQWRDVLARRQAADDSSSDGDD